MLRGAKNNQQLELESRSAPIPEIERKIGEMLRSLRENQSLFEAQVFSQVGGMVY